MQYATSGSQAKRFTLTAFAEFSKTVGPQNRDDMIKIGNLLAGDRFMAITVDAVAAIDRGDIAEVIKHVNPSSAVDRWMTAIEDYLGIKFKDAFTTPRTSSALRFGSSHDQHRSQTR